MSKKIRLMNAATRLYSILLIAVFLLASASLANATTVNVATSKGVAVSAINVYAFTQSGTYTGKSGTTNSAGIATIDTSTLASGNYKFRADYLGGQLWSQVVTLPDTSSVNLTIETSTAQITATTAVGPATGIKVYLFSGTGSYLGINVTTDAQGNAIFELPVGKDFKFRADILGNQYWSSIATIQSGVINDVAVNAGGGTFQITVDKGSGIALTGINVYLFSSTGSYLGLYQTTNASGMVSFNVPQGSYKVRADYMGSQFWTDIISVTGNTSTELSVPHQNVTVTVQGAYQSSSTPIEGIKVYLFSSTGSYLSQYGTTDGNGNVTFNLPEKAYKVRADYLGMQFWSDSFTWQNASVNIPMADAKITVIGNGQPLGGINVYVFSSTGSYLSVNGTSDSAGDVTFSLPAADYKFRADYQGSQYWSDVVALQADQINNIPISTGGGLFNLTVLKGASDPLAGVNCYVFNQSGSYLGISGITGSNGQVSFSLANGNYKIRVDYLGSQFWTDAYEIPNVLSGDFTISHQDILIDVNGIYQGISTPIHGINVYLFSSTGSYLGQSRVTDSSGNATFNLPEQPYKVRADYLGMQFWSDNFTWQNAPVNIPMADAEVTVTGSGQALAGVNVYVFSASGSYLGIHNTTDATGRATFRVPAGRINSGPIIREVNIGATLRNCNRIRQTLLQYQPGEEYLN
jgi:hypothetical protein